ncbi:MAG: helix-turn-helix transcriptional regulator, partial [Lachnospiraceae bacterium]|nr:helix-turn-helix transcriptional regulator [Lachnospiraceae bacterium]
MDQKKVGSFLKELRKEKGITQEQLAEKLNVSGRSVSRWETGNNMPDISLLVEIADFYDVDVREIIEGERKSEMMNKEVREVATKMADYANTEKGRLLKVVRLIGIIGVIILAVAIILQ